jgi:hypothetical protein
MKYAWDELYAGETYRYGLKPNRFLALMLEGRAPGSLLLVAVGKAATPFTPPSKIGR